ncbi:hypothetical protein [Sorangium sp. So ce341]|uniref:hypothetical protein n=1 Tax=Sorangium sp. So ce341 TaxID=3133302 RepID=UPI003F62A899
MKNFARWGLALAAVMSVSSSAMAIDNYTVYDVAMKNGPSVVNVGTIRWSFLDYDISPFSSGCLNAATWCTPNSGPMSCAMLMAREEMMIGALSCEEISECFADTVITDFYDPRFKNEGYDVRRQKKKIVRLALAQDGLNGVTKGMCQLGSPMSVPNYITLTPLVRP